MSSSTVTTMFDTFLDTINDVLTTNLPLILTIAAALIGLGIVIRYVKRWVGRR